MVTFCTFTLINITFALQLAVQHLQTEDAHLRHLARDSLHLVPTYIYIEEIVLIHFLPQIFQ